MKLIFLFFYFFFFLQAGATHSLKSKLQVLSFMITPNYRRCPFFQKLTGGVLYLSKSCTLCPLGQT
ncbi:hypothetical protein Hanom_Chr00s188654g01834091 [Helianthus anomalus]